MYLIFIKELVLQKDFTFTRVSPLGYRGSKLPGVLGCSQVARNHPTPPSIQEKEQKRLSVEQDIKELQCRAENLPLLSLSFLQGAVSLL